MTIPERIGKYGLTRKLGEGAMGVVYEAFDPDIRRPLAIKTIRRDLIDSDQGVAAAAARFRNEAQAAGRLLHPGIAAVYEYGETEQCAYIAMEYVPGEPLREFIARGIRFAEQDVLSVMVQLLEALQYAHEQGVWHRDIKPANMIVTRNGRVKIADFGIARIENMGLTVDGALIGTPGYMAPEQFGDDPIDHRVDLYACGAVLYQLLTGRQVHTGSMESVMLKTVSEAPRVPSELEGCGHWARYDPIVLKALARDRDERFASARAFQQALVALSMAPVSASVSDETLVMMPQRRAEAGLAHAAGLQSQPGRTGAPPASSASSISTAGTAPPTGWDPQLLTELEATLARHVGPMARILVRRAAAQARDAVQLRELLAEHVPDGQARTRFVQGARTLGAAPTGTRGTVFSGGLHAGTQGSSASTATGMGQPVDEPLLERATVLLTQRLGPIARVLVRKAAAQGSDRASFCAALLAQVADASEAQALAAELERLCQGG